MKNRIVSVLATLLVSVMIISCSKDNGNPTVKFVPGPGFSGKDTVIRVNYTVTVVLQIDWNGVDELKQLDVKLNDELVESFALSGQSVTYNLGITKGTQDTEKWTFEVIDTKKNNSSINLTLTKDPNSEYGTILYYTPVVLGAQNNTATGGFLGFANQKATIYTLEGAFANQALIDLVYYSDLVTHATLGSPAADIPSDLFPGSRNITLWSVKNETRFMKSTLTASDFDGLSNDAGILNAWSDSKSVAKAGELKVNDVWLAKLSSGRKAAILVKAINGSDDGNIELAVKIQD